MTTPAPSFQFNSPAVAAAKALAILLMVMGHANSPQYLQDYLSMMRMPLFFIMSGYCFKAKYLNDGRTFVMKRVKGVWWPYVKWMLVFLALHNVFFYLNIYNDVYGYRYRGWYNDVSHLFTWQEWGMKSLRTLNFSSDERLLGGYWFLKELFWASLIGYAVLWIAYNWHKAPWCRWHAKCGTPAMTSPAVSMLTIVIIGGGILTLLFLFAYQEPAFHIRGLGISQRTWMATLFYLFGHVWRRWEEGGTWLSRYDSLHWGWQAAIVLVLGVTVQLIVMRFGSTSMLGFAYWNAIPYMTAALCGSVMIVYVSRWLVARAGWLRNFLVFTGHHTFEVLTWHFLCFKLTSLLIIAIYGLDIERLAMFPVIDTEGLRECGFAVEWTLWWWAYLIVGAGVPLLWQWVRLRKRT